MRLIWSRRALHGLRDIQLALNAAQAGAGDRTGERILAAVDPLHDFPALGRAIGPGGTRLLVVARTQYLILYDLQPDRLEIVDVFHGGRPWSESGR